VSNSPRNQQPGAKPPVRDSGPVEGVRGNREVPPTIDAAVETPTVEETPEQEEDELVALQRERDEYLDALQRLKADFENYRKRAAREYSDTVVRANERLVKELLPVLDDLGRALVAADEHEEVKLVEGVQLVHRQLSALLEREGLAEIETDGRFDPHVHEALMSQPSEEDEGTVIEVVQKGYRLGDRVLRPARVVVAAAKD
jgi:molecular chaperone GrpE